ncbi:hypothetical protein LCGC14_2731360, partial [marine sediment metagenome]
SVNVGTTSPNMALSIFEGHLFLAGISRALR